VGQRKASQVESKKGAQKAAVVQRMVVGQKMVGVRKMVEVQ